MSIISILLVTSITFIGYTLTNGNDKYYELEKEILINAKSRDNQDIYVNFELLNKNKCDGFVVRESSLFKDKYKAFIRCKDYKTYNYDKYAKKYGYWLTIQDITVIIILDLLKILSRESLL